MGKVTVRGAAAWTFCVQNPWLIRIEKDYFQDNFSSARPLFLSRIEVKSTILVPRTSSLQPHQLIESTLATTHTGSFALPSTRSSLFYPTATCVGLYFDNALGLDDWVPELSTPVPRHLSACPPPAPSRLLYYFSHFRPRCQRPPGLAPLDAGRQSLSISTAAASLGFLSLGTGQTRLEPDILP